MSNSSGFGGAIKVQFSESSMSDLTDAILGRRTSKPALYSSQIPDPQIIRESIEE